MLQVIALALGVGAGIQAFRQWPPDGPVSTDVAVTLFVIGLAIAYLGGRWHGRGGARANATATATAVAKSEATGNVVNVAVFTPGGATASGLSVPTESTPWLGGPRPTVEVDDLDGMDVAELLAQDAEEDA